MSELNLLYTDVEDDLRASVRAALNPFTDPTALAAMYDGDRSAVEPLWRSLAGDLGLAGLLVPEDLGGHGASAREAAVVLEELGRTVAAAPFLTSAVIATTVLVGARDPLVEELATGARTAALLIPWSTAPESNLTGLRVVDGQVSGRVTSVAGALEADLFIVPVGLDGRLAVFVVDAHHTKIEPVVSLDMTRQLADVSLEAVPASLVADDAEGLIRQGLLSGAALLASEQVGLARWCLETTVSYLKERRQFGRVLGGFQALKHRLADLYTETESAAAAARYAAAALAADETDAAIGAAVAQAFCSDVAVHAAEEAVQLHAGIGMTWEHPAHLYLKRAKSDQIALGTPGLHRAALAPLVGVEAPA